MFVVERSPDQKKHRRWGDVPLVLVAEEDDEQLIILRGRSYWEKLIPTEMKRIL